MIQASEASNFFVQLDDLTQMRRACFLFTLKKEFDVRSWFDATCFERINAVRIAITPALSSAAERA